MNAKVDVKKIREAKGLTQKELADMCGVTTRTVQNWENGGTIPDMVQKYFSQLEEQGETVSSSASGSSVSVAAARGSSVNVGKETERLLALLEHSQKQIDAHLEMSKAKDAQITSLLSVVERLTTK